MLIALGLLVALALAGACGGGEEERPPAPTATARATVSATPSATAESPVAVGLPEGFPEDFPIYEEAVTRVASLTPEEGSFLVSIDTEHSRDQVQTFYERVLNEDPWQMDNVDVVDVPEEEDEVVIIEFARVGDGGEWGTVAIGIVRENGQHATIGISLNLPQ
jgi:hypothetical protein